MRFQIRNVHRLAVIPSLVVGLGAPLGCASYETEDVTVSATTLENPGTDSGADTDPNSTLAHETEDPSEDVAVSAAALEDLGPDPVADTDLNSLLVLPGLQPGVTSGAWGTIVGQGGLCLAWAPNGPTTVLGNVRAHMALCDGSAAQKWRHSSTKQIFNQASNQCLNIEEGVHGTSVILYPCTQEANVFNNEVWEFETLPDGRSRIVNRGKSGASGKCLNVYEGRREVGTGVIVWPCTSGLPNDTWYPQPFMREISMQFIRLSDDNGTNGATVTPAEMTEIIGMVNGVFHRAGIRFRTDNAIWWNIADSGLNTIAGDANGHDAELRAIALGQPDRLTVFLPRSGGGFAGMSPTLEGLKSDYAKMPGSVTGDVGIGPFQTGKRGYAKLMAHELGHYFGLAHTVDTNIGDGKERTFDMRARDLLDEHAGNTTTAYDADGSDDTFPDPGPWLFEMRNAARYGLSPAYLGCLDEPTITFTSTSGWYTRTMLADRTNLMGYFFCDASPVPPSNRIEATLNPGQLARAYSVAVKSRSFLK